MIFTPYNFKILPLILNIFGQIIRTPIDFKLLWVAHPCSWYLFNKSSLCFKSQIICFIKDFMLWEPNIFKYTIDRDLNINCLLKFLFNSTLESSLKLHHAGKLKLKRKNNLLKVSFYVQKAVKIWKQAWERQEVIWMKLDLNFMGYFVLEMFRTFSLQKHSVKQPKDD